jgi:hypothetical protein
MYEQSTPKARQNTIKTPTYLNFELLRTRTIIFKKVDRTGLQKF